MSLIDDFIGTIILGVAYFAFKANYFTPDLVSGFTKGELYIFVLLMAFILIWSCCHAASFIANILGDIISAMYRVVWIDRKETVETLKNIKKKIDAVIVAMRS